MLLHGLAFLFLGFVISYAGYSSIYSPFNLYEVVGPALFWYALLLLLLAYPLRRVAGACLVGLRTRIGASIFSLYLMVHLLVYGFLLEVILSSVYGVAFSLSPSLIVSTELFTPASIYNTLLDVSFSPSISFTLPPMLSGALSLYAVAVAVLVDIVIVANVTKTLELGRFCSHMILARSYFLVPMLGLVLGAACCISIPALISFAHPPILTSTSFDWVYNVTYFFFPTFAVLILYLNAISIDWISATLRSTGTN